MATGDSTKIDCECRVTVPEASSVTPEPETALYRGTWLVLLGLLRTKKSTIFDFMKMMWRLGADDPRKLIHGVKVGIALALVSFYYYTQPLYDGVGDAAMWAVMTVVVTFEFTVGKHRSIGNWILQKIGPLDLC